MSSGCGRNTVAWWRGCGRPVRPGRPTPTWPTPCFPTRCSRVSRGSLVPPAPCPAPCPAARPAPAVADAVLPQRLYPAPSAQPSTSWASCGGCWSTSSGGCGCSTWCRRARLPSSAAWRSACASSASPSGVAPHSPGGGGRVPLGAWGRPWALPEPRPPCLGPPRCQCRESVVRAGGSGVTARRGTRQTCRACSELLLGPRAGQEPSRCHVASSESLPKESLMEGLLAEGQAGQRVPQAVWVLVGAQEFPPQATEAGERAVLEGGLLTRPGGEVWGEKCCGSPGLLSLPASVSLCWKPEGRNTPTRQVVGWVSPPSTEQAEHGPGSGAGPFVLSCCSG